MLAHRARGARAPGALGIAFASATLRCGFFAGLAAGCVVLVHHVDAGAALVLVVLVCSYEAGDYLVGSGSTTALEGPAAGCIGVLVATFAVVVVRPDLFGGSASLWAMGVATGLACPLGQLAASAILPSGGTFAPALRRLDSYLVAAPLWAFVLLGGLGAGPPLATLSHGVPARWPAAALRRGGRPTRGQLTDRSLGELRTMRLDCEQAEAAVSFTRRVLHGRLDLLASEEERRQEPQPVAAPGPRAAGRGARATAHGARGAALARPAPRQPRWC